ncbi:MFS transporter [Rhodococcus pseudokoreensis]|uniref:MFS transporter n=1 Tax=Rhodococcus pseudokoreensis TaxID=2811421 RepID=A0A974VYV4_9NOCA|nr:MFS transporter [Rhodococcus pseudokoreensis]QSE88103.1 MFS transporter [Rhodococcus pseudokoreensis]
MDPSTDDPQNRSRGAFRLTVDPVFGPFFWGKLLSSCGTWTFVVVAAILTFDLSGSAWAVGMVTVAHSAPQLLFAPFSGQLADRGKAATQIVAGSLLTGVGAGGLALWLWLSGGSGRTVRSHSGDAVLRRRRTGLRDRRPCDAIDRARNDQTGGNDRGNVAEHGPHHGRQGRWACHGCRRGTLTGCCSCFCSGSRRLESA